MSRRACLRIASARGGPAGGHAEVRGELEGGRVGWVLGRRQVVEAGGLLDFADGPSTAGQEEVGTLSRIGRDHSLDGLRSDVGGVISHLERHQGQPGVRTVRLLLDQLEESRLGLLRSAELPEQAGQGVPHVQAIGLGLDEFRDRPLGRALVALLERHVGREAVDLRRVAQALLERGNLVETFQPGEQVDQAGQCDRGGIAAEGHPIGGDRFLEPVVLLQDEGADQGS